MSDVQIDCQTEAEVDNYHDDNEYLTKTALSVFCESPQDYYRQFITHEMPRKRVGKPALVGTVLHAMLLEKKRFDEVVAVYPSDCFKSNQTLNPTPAARFRSDNDGLVCMKQAEADAIGYVYDAVRKGMLADALEQGQHFEQTFKGMAHGSKAKCKPDIACDMGDYWLIYDLKFMESVDPSTWRMSARKYRYWLQVVHYSTVLQSIANKPVQFRFIACETKYPYRVQGYWYTPDRLENALIYHKTKIIDLQACVRSGDWSDNWPNETPLEPWELDYIGDGEVQLDWEDAA